MRTPVRRTAAAFWVLCVGLISEPAEAAWRCRARPVEACVTQHGRRSSQNGRALIVWLIGTTRVVGLENDLEELPPFVRRYLALTSPDHSYVYGDFEICPLEPDRPGHMRTACVVSAKRLVVQNLRRSRPAFRLLSTWTDDDAVGSPEGVTRF